MQIKVLFFASLRELFDMPERLIDIDQDDTLTAETLLAYFSDKEKGAWVELLTRKKSVRIAINQTLSSWNAPLNEGDELAFLPPITGG